MLNATKFDWIFQQVLIFMLYIHWHGMEMVKFEALV